MILSQTSTTLMVLIVAVILSVTSGQTTTTKQKCDNVTHGKIRLYQNKNGDDEILICAKNNGTYRWRFIDGSPSLGGKFNPAKDCSDIVDNFPNAKDGIYWIVTADGNVVKAWCDVNTAGGGFMLLGKQDDPSSWNVPFKTTTITPSGPPQWSANFGNLTIREFAVQVSTTSDFEGTRAHWSYKFNRDRPLGELLGVKNGCSITQSGVGDVEHILDILANTVINKFSCSQFGPNVDPKLGWGSMNRCFRDGCSSGYAYFSVIPIRLDSFGSFSYSAVSKLSGVTYNSTAFVGCHNGKCCACFGPKGGRKNYCAAQCKPLNGGTVAQKAHVWFWVRTSVPRRVWKKCMEFKTNTDQGNMETHYIDRETGSARKGSCSDQFHTFLNEGTLSVSKKEDLHRIPSVPGLLSYCKENKGVFFNDGNQWNNLAREKQVEARNKALEDNLIKTKDEYKKKVESLQARDKQHEDNLIKTKEEYKKKSMIKQLDDNLTKTKEEYRKKVESLQTRIKELEEITYGGNNLTLSSQILLNKVDYLKQLTQWLPTQTSWKLCWRASQHGWASTEFHSRCDFKGPTVTIIRVGVYVFGGYSDISWGGSSGYRRSSNSWIFSLKNKDDLHPFRAPVFRNKDYAIFTNNGCGPTFGGHDIYIPTNAHSTTYSYSEFGHTYKPPPGYRYLSSNTGSLLAGSEFFTPSEVEVFFQR